MCMCGGGAFVHTDEHPLHHPLPPVSSVYVSCTVHVYCKSHFVLILGIMCVG